MLALSWDMAAALRNDAITPVNGDVKGLVTTWARCTISWLIRTLGEGGSTAILPSLNRVPNPAPLLAFKL